MKNELVFDPFRHEYRLNGIKIPGVTSCLSDIPEELRFSSAFIRKTEIGKKVHDICESIALHMLNDGGKRRGHRTFKMNPEQRGWVKHEPVINEYVIGFRRWLDESKYTILEAEQKLVSIKYRYAGTCDIVARDDHGRLVIMDIKTTNGINPSVALQLAAYAQAYEEISEEKVHHREVLLLEPEGTYKTKHYRDQRADFHVFLCKLVSRNWDLANGLAQ